MKHTADQPSATDRISSASHKSAAKRSLSPPFTPSVIAPMKSTASTAAAATATTTTSAPGSSSTLRVGTLETHPSTAANPSSTTPSTSVFGQLGPPNRMSQVPTHMPAMRTPTAASTPASTATGTAPASAPVDDDIVTRVLNNKWQYSDESLTQALALRAEQERTRQEYYKLELRKYSLDLLREAIAYNVPPSTISVIFGDPVAVSQSQPVTAIRQPLKSPHSPKALSTSSTATPTTTGGMLHRTSIPSTTLSASSFRPGHQHHSSTSAIPVFRTQPAYTSPQRYPQSSATAFFPPPQQSTSIGQQPSSPSSLQHIIQFHHWQPSQTKAGMSQQQSGQSSPKREAFESGGEIKRRKSIIDRSTSPSPAAGASPASTSSQSFVNASAHSRRRLGHARHRSEASILRGGRDDLYNRSIYSSSTDGVSVLASIASEQQRVTTPHPPHPKTPSPKTPQAQTAESREPQAPAQPDDDRGAHKHGVGFIISESQ